MSTSDKEINARLDIMEAVEKQLDRQRHEAVLCLTACVALICGWVLLVALWEQLGRPVEPRTMTWGVEIIAVLMMFFVLKFTSIRFSDFGVTKKGVRGALLRGAALSVALGGTFFGLACLRAKGVPSFDLAFLRPVYILTAVLQEFLARGVFINCLLKIFVGKRGPAHAVAVSALMFAALHLYYGFTFMCLAGAMSLILGFVYLRDRNIWGASLIHFVLGSLAFMLQSGAGPV